MLKVCKNKKCLKEHNGEFGSGQFCSKSCANSRKVTAETKRRISEGRKKYIAKNGDKSCCARATMTPERYALYLKNRRENVNRRLLAKDFKDVGAYSLRKRIVLEQNGACNNCGLSKWLDAPIPLELEHKDGNSENNSRENLECLCPNCHALTTTWRGRNKSNHGGNKKKVSDEEICKAFFATENIRQTLLRVGLAAKGGNYERVKKCLTLAGIKYD